mmetsp:Transcript_18195/g.32349  ORF Transcript_18195/g.32349 Transcript_18195/m.32349 type:complete len:266 (+) Transcript_18195:190-987(+)
MNNYAPTLTPVNDRRQPRHCCHHRSHGNNATNWRVSCAHRFLLWYNILITSRYPRHTEAAFRLLRLCLDTCAAELLFGELLLIVILLDFDLNPLRDWIHEVPNPHHCQHQAMLHCKAHSNHVPTHPLSQYLVSILQHKPPRHPSHELLRGEGEKEAICENGEGHNGSEDAVPDPNAVHRLGRRSTVHPHQLEAVRLHFDEVGQDADPRGKGVCRGEQRDVAELNDHLQVVIERFIFRHVHLLNGLRQEGLAVVPLAVGHPKLEAR